MTDHEVLSAIGFGIAKALHDPADYPSPVCAAVYECMAIARYSWWIQLLPNTPAPLQVHYVPFCDGQRFACVPWCRLHDAATDYGLLVFDVDHYVCDWDQDLEFAADGRVIAVSPETFDRLVGS